MDYLHVIEHYPLFAYHFAVSVWGGLLDLPWPEGRQLFGSICTFLIITTIRYAAHLAVRSRKKYRVGVPNNQPASMAASMADLIHHF